MAKRSFSDRDDDEKVVYSTHPQPAKAVVSTETGYSGPLRPAWRLERKGRNGKCVTVLFKLPKHATLLKDLCAFLKKALGAGGTYKIESEQGLIEIQGDYGASILTQVEKYAERRGMATQG